MECQNVLFGHLRPDQVPELSPPHADDSPASRRLKKFEHVWRRAEQQPSVSSSSGMASSSVQQPAALPAAPVPPTLLERADIFEDWFASRTAQDQQDCADAPSKQEKKFKWGECPKCQCARSPHVFSAQSAACRAGQAATDGGRLMIVEKGCVGKWRSPRMNSCVSSHVSRGKNLVT